MNGGRGVLDAACPREYDNSTHGRVQDPVILPDFKNDPGRNGDARIFPCWTASSFFFLYLQISVV